MQKLAQFALYDVILNLAILLFIEILHLGAIDEVLAGVTFAVDIGVIVLIVTFGTFLAFIAVLDLFDSKSRQNESLE